MITRQRIPPEIEARTIAAMLSLVIFGVVSTGETRGRGGSQYNFIVDTERWGFLEQDLVFPFRRVCERYLCRHVR
jgi:hypothetical protein